MKGVLTDLAEEGLGGGADFCGQHTLGRWGSAQPDHLEKMQEDGSGSGGAVLLDLALYVGRRGEEGPGS